VLLAAPDSLLQFTDKFHLLPFVILFLFLTLVNVLAMGAKSCLRCVGEVVEALYDFKAQCAASKRRYLEAVDRTTTTVRR